MDRKQKITFNTRVAKTTSLIVQAVAEILLDKKSPTRKMTTFDLGFGNSRKTVKIYKRKLKEVYPKIQIKMIGMEQNKTRLDEALKRKIIDEGYLVDFNQKFINSAIKSQADLVVTTQVIEHLYNPFHFLQEIKKLLKPTGILILSTMNNAQFWDRINAFRGYVSFDQYCALRWEEKTKKRYGHIRYFSWRELREIMKELGYQNLKLYSTVVRLFPFRPKIGEPGVYSTIMAKIFPSLGFTLIIKAQKGNN